MKRRSFFATLAVAALAWGLSAPAAQAASTPLSTLLGTDVAFGGLTFHFQGYINTGSAPDAADVAVTFFTTGNEICFTLNGAFGALAGENNDSNLVYSVSGTGINDALLQGNMSAAPGSTGIASVTETLHSGSIVGPVVAPPPMHIQNPGPLQDSRTFEPESLIWVIKDIESHGGNLGVSLSEVTQCFSVVPEPPSIALLGVGLTCLLAFRRKVFRRNAIVDRG